MMKCLKKKKKKKSHILFHRSLSLWEDEAASNKWNQRVADLLISIEHGVFNACRVVLIV